MRTSSRHDHDHGHGHIHGHDHDHGHGHIHSHDHGHDHKTEQQASHTVLADRSIFIAWKPDYEMGVLIIDEQHRGIVAAINSLYYATQHGMGGAMLPHVVGLVTEYASIHFRTEEELFGKCGFPDEEEHRELHAALSRKTVSVGRNSVENRDPREFLHFMRDWWVEHICNADMAFKKHLAAMG